MLSFLPQLKKVCTFKRCHLILHNLQCKYTVGSYWNKLSSNYYFRTVAAAVAGTAMAPAEVVAVRDSAVPRGRYFAFGVSAVVHRHHNCSSAVAAVVVAAASVGSFAAVGLASAVDNSTACCSSWCWPSG